jgi:ER lumen protein retaining receptor
MNLFLFFGDFLHLFSFVLIIFKVCFDRNYCLISIEMQMIKTFCFLLRFLDLFFFRINFYNSIMKIIIIILNLIIMKLLLNQNKKINKKILFFIIKISFFFSIFSFNFWWFDLIYSFSLWLESFSILAEIFLLENEKKDEFIFFYLFVIFFYRIFYFFNWIFNYFYQAKFYLIKFLTIGNQIIIIFIFFIKNFYKNKIKKIK